MPRDWTWLLLLDAALLIGATAVIIGLFLRDLHREVRAAKKNGTPDERPIRKENR